MGRTRAEMEANVVTARSDQDVRREVIGALVDDPRVDVSNVDVEVAGGIVYLRGSVSSDYERHIVGEVARSAKGVVEVANEVRVALTRARSDAELAADVRAALAHDSRLDASRVTADVRMRVACLTGTLDSHVQRLHAEEDAWSVPGLIDVDDKVALNPAVRRSDDEIAADVRSRLSAESRLARGSIVVQVERGVVHLRGSVPTLHERRLAEDRTWPTVGVRSVVNELRIIP